MAERKYFSEFGINMFAKRCISLQQNDLPRIGDAGFGPDYPFHIYMITRRPRITLDKDSIVFEDRVVKGNFKVQRQNSFDTIPFAAPNQLGSSVRMECPYPHTEFFIYNENDDLVSAGKAAQLMTNFAIEGWLDAGDVLDLEVLYIGQSYGIEGARTAPQRLQSHSTLQEIYFDSMAKSPDKEIWLLLLSFDEPYLMVSFDGITGSYGTTMKEDEAHYNNVLGGEITEQQRINYTEAAMIRYFAPEYNDKFKYNFPNPAHTSYSQCYDLDLNSVCVELNTEHLWACLWSDTVQRGYLHLIQYTLESPEDRKDMFEL